MTARPPLNFNVPVSAVAILNAPDEPKESDWPEIRSPFPVLTDPPRYVFGQGLIPKTYEDFVHRICSVKAGYPEPYFASFLVSCASVIHTSVQVQLTEGDEDSFTPFVDQTINVSEPSSGKTPTQQALYLMAQKIDRGNRASQAAQYETLSKEARAGFVWKSMLSTNATIEALEKTIATNGGDPHTWAPAEGNTALVGAAIHRADGSDPITIALRAGWDAGFYERKRASEGKPNAVDTFALNAIFSTTPEDLSNWAGFESACRNGTMGRITLTTCGQRLPYDPNVTDLPAATYKVHKIMEQLYKLENVNVMLPVGFGSVLHDYEKAQRDHALTHRSANRGYSEWIDKNPKRLVRWAGVFALWDYLEGDTSLLVKHGDKMNTVIRMRPDHVVRALTFIEDYLAAQQLYIYRYVMNNDQVGVEVRNITNRILAGGLMSVKRDDLIYSGSNTVRSWNGQWQSKDKLLEVFRRLISYGILLPDYAKRGSKGAPEMASSYLVNPKVHIELAAFKQEAESAVIERREKLMTAIKNRMEEQK